MHIHIVHFVILQTAPCVCVTKEMEAQAAETGDDVKLNINSMVKPLHKLIADNKDIAKVIVQLNAAVVMHRSDVSELLNVFSVYDELWKTSKMVTICRLSWCTQY